MAEKVSSQRAELIELDSNGKPQPGENSPIPVQFNPETLKLSFSNQVTPPANNGTSDQNATSSTQFVGKGTTKLSLQLWFDVTGMLPNGLATQPEDKKDVRRLTSKVGYFITPKEVETDKYLPPAVRFQWGTFMFDGIMDSMEESLEFFSEDGIPLRASLSISISQQKIKFEFASTPNGQGANGVPGGDTPGTKPLAQAKAGLSLQAMASLQGKDWQAVASANGIENPRMLQPGQLVNMNVSKPSIRTTGPSVTISGPSINIGS